MTSNASSSEPSAPQPGDPNSLTSDSATGKLSAFGGVFTPSILTILGVVMYLRFGWVLGNTGLAGALLIVGVSHLITLATGLSVASIATNRTVGAGGAYYIISRSLGAPAGAAIGIPLFFGQALSVSFYVIGFTESIQTFVPTINPVIIGSCVCAFLTLISLKSTALAIKTQYIVMAAIGLSLVAFFTGTGENPPAEIPWDAPENGAPFAVVFAVFFPAVTGIMAGVGMSGDLKDPRRALPRGTLAAILVGFVVYSVFPIWLAHNTSLESMRANPNIIWDIASVPELIFLGVWGATLSSAIGSLLTAPRTLQALSFDGLAPRFLGRSFGPNKEPRMGLLFTFGLAELGILFGNLDMVANILTMFFLATYGFTNLACGLERWAASPSFRPDFAVPAWISLLGAVGSFYVMSVISLQAMIASFVVCGAIYIFVQRRTLNTTYGDARHGMWAALVRTSLHHLRRTEFHPVNWRPNLIILGGGLDDRPYLLELGSTVVQDRGIVTYFQLLKGKVSAMATKRQKQLEFLESQYKSRFPNVFFRAEVVEDIHQGAVAVSQSYGIGNFEANTVMTGWPLNADQITGYVGMLQDLSHLERSLLLIRYRSDLGFSRRREIHIWWSGKPGSGGLMLLISFLITAHFRWRKANVSIFRIVDSEKEGVIAQKEFAEILRVARLPAATKVIRRQGRNTKQIIQENSKNADLAMLGFQPPREKDLGKIMSFYREMNALMDGLPTTILVRAGSSFQVEPILVEAPQQGELDLTPGLQPHQSETEEPSEEHQTARKSPLVPEAKKDKPQ
jgi:amino acid transporter